MTKPPKKTFQTTIVRDGSACFIPVPFDPAPVFGKVRAPVIVTLAGYAFPSTIAAMGNGPCLPFRRSHREAAGLDGTETLRVTLELDTSKREVAAPKDLVAALTAAHALERWRALSFSHQREHAVAIDGAAKPETRARRVASAVAMVLASRAVATKAKTTAKPTPKPPAKPTAKTTAKPAAAPKTKPGAGTSAAPWKLSTPPGTSAFEAHRDESADPPALVVQVGKTQVRYALRCIADLHAMLLAHGDWMPLGGADEQKPAADGTVEAWGRATSNPIGGWYGLKKGLRGRFGVYVPPVLEAMGLVELEHNAKNNRMRGIKAK